jgi:hypothetical protein
LAEWLLEDGIGETRAILVEDDEIVEAAIELPDTLRSGTVAEARLTSILVPGRRGIATVDDGREVLIEPLPPALTEGQALRIEIVREPISETGRAKLAKGKASDLPARPGPTLAERIGAFTPNRVPGRDRFEQAGWSELLEEAASGEIAFPGGALRMSLTPAMTLFDVDGALPPAALAEAGAQAAGRAIRRLGISGSIGIDLPTLAARDQRLAVAAALDQVLPQPFERTAMNGFGFLQIIRRRERASIPELIRADPVGAAARALLRRAERSAGAGDHVLHAAPAVAARLLEAPDWLDLLARRLGARVEVREEIGLGLSAGHVQSRHA